MSNTMEACEFEVIADELMEVIKPYYKSLRRPDEKPDFRKCLKSSEVEDILSSVHDIVVRLKIQNRDDHQ